jgi:hypothetical protein
VSVRFPTHGGVSGRPSEHGNTLGRPACAWTASSRKSTSGNWELATVLRKQRGTRPNGQVKYSEVRNRFDAAGEHLRLRVWAERRVPKADCAGRFTPAKPMGSLPGAWQYVGMDRGLLSTKLCGCGIRWFGLDSRRLQTACAPRRFLERISGASPRCQPVRGSPRQSVRRRLRFPRREDATGRGGFTSIIGRRGRRPWRGLVPTVRLAYRKRRKDFVRAAGLRQL